MKLRSNKKGFTLVEIIATITILAIISVIGIISVTNILEKGKTEHYLTAEKNLGVTGESYVQTNRNYLPKNVGERTKVTLRKLKEDNYIEGIKDYNGKECNLDDSYVEIFKYSKTGYTYIPHLKCNNYETNIDEKKDMKPKIYIVMTNDSNNVSTANAEITIKDENKILSYTISIYKYNDEVYSTGNMEANYNTIINQVIDISKYTPGTIKVVVTATNIYGITETVTKTSKYKDDNDPICGAVTAETKVTPGDWTNKNRKITIACTDENGSGCTRETFTKTFKEDAKTGIITIKDKAGNTTDCKVDVYIDKTKPECTITLNKPTPDGLNSWYVSDVSVSMTTEEKEKYDPVFKENVGSGLYTDNEYRGLQNTPRTSGVYNKQVSGVQSDTTGIIWYGHVQDKAGNIGVCETSSFKVDTTPPTQPTSGKVSVSGSSTSATVGKASGSSDATSGVAEYRYIINNTGNTPDKNLTAFTTSRTFTRSCGTSYYGYAIAVDKAGNRSDVYYMGSDYDNVDSWGNWGNCSVLCGGGKKYRYNTCELIARDSKDCNTQGCCSSTHTEKGNWSKCYGECGTGTQYRDIYYISDYDGSVCDYKEGKRECDAGPCDSGGCSGGHDYSCRDKENPYTLTTSRWTCECGKTHTTGFRIVCCDCGEARTSSPTFWCPNNYHPSVYYG